MVDINQNIITYYKSAKTKLNLRISNHRKDALKLNAIPADRNLTQEITIFNTDAKFAIIEQRQNTKLKKESITEILKKRENFE